METTEQMMAMDGTQGSEEFMMVGNELLRPQDFEAQDEAMRRHYKRLPKWWPREWRATHREVWVWKFGHDRFGNATCYRADSRLVEIG